ncbi:hypothetical protein VNO77_44041 [Canavalia gladiata]|uniref:Uncharacterized protein n=1 Tax=Canavalia gladiata TaxID=3824 RepID=A0AAN9JXU4_CANGL
MKCVLGATSRNLDKILPISVRLLHSLGAPTCSIIELLDPRRPARRFTSRTAKPCYRLHAPVSMLLVFPFSSSLEHRIPLQKVSPETCGRVTKEDRPHNRVTEFSVPESGSPAEFLQGYEARFEFFRPLSGPHGVMQAVSYVNMWIFARLDYQLLEEFCAIILLESKSFTFRALSKAKEANLLRVEHLPET